MSHHLEPPKRRMTSISVGCLLRRAGHCRLLTAQEGAHANSSILTRQVSRRASRIVLVAAIIVDADRQWRKLVTRLSEIAREHAVGPDVAFHAKDLLHGRKTFPQDRWTLPEQLEILKKLVSTPRLYSVPFCSRNGFLRRNQITLPELPPMGKAAARAHMVAFIPCVLAAEQYMRSEGRDLTGLCGRRGK